MVASRVMTEVKPVSADWMAEFGDWLRESGRDELTVEGYMGDMRVFTGWWMEANKTAFEPGQMNSMDVNAFRTWELEVKRVKPATWNRHRTALRIFCDWLTWQKGVPMPFIFDYKIPLAIEQPHAPKWLSESDSRRLLRQCELDRGGARTEAKKRQALRNQAIVFLMRFAGLRVGEVIGLRWQDIKMSERKGSVTVWLGKRGKTRTVPMSVSLRGVLTEWMDACASRKDEDHLFEVNDRAVQKMIGELGKRAGLEDLNCHSLRHTCAKSMVDAGRPLTEVQRILGHEKLDTTGIYVQPGDEDLADAVDAGELGRMARYDGKKERKGK